ncbi:LysM peptidoglycan-binding domain-containing protein [Psychromonas sp. RZ22]|uniref:peptidoglycan DD-metalloendopeptidase family protein n=1 Tax=Psychromonas algarum TaxID=2555643 RepID=UPI001067FF0E|nr:peptidoglycan DD-metalloendopeptidase family protein [Psychromonas sp. RZ22]TEW53463.1 LysM peptidoglycan-binding domain-containing protein [Psychromonas sp. RZ22]
MKTISFIFVLFVLTACSSHSSRAPVYDVKSHQGSRPSVYSSTEEYVVKSGDTLYGIAWRTDSDVEALIQRNNLKPPYLIRTGQVLKLQESNNKTASHSQKTHKPGATSCTGQSCKQNIKSRVVKNASNEYSANKVVEKNATKQQSSQQENNEKVSDWQWPSKGRLTKTFGSSSQGMKGISISNARGTPIYAASAGKVVYAGSGLRGYGNLIIIKHNHDYLSAYAHNEKILIKENELVKVGQKIALMGDSGTRSVGLHFDIRYRGKSVDPLRYLPKR